MNEVADKDIVFEKNNLEIFLELAKNKTTEIDDVSLKIII